MSQLRRDESGCDARVARISGGNGSAARGLPYSVNPCIPGGHFGIDLL